MAGSNQSKAPSSEARSTETLSVTAPVSAPMPRSKPRTPLPFTWLARCIMWGGASVLLIFIGLLAGALDPVISWFPELALALGAIFGGVALRMLARGWFKEDVRSLELAVATALLWSFSYLLSLAKQIASLLFFLALASAVVYFSIHRFGLTPGLLLGVPIATVLLGTGWFLTTRYLSDKSSNFLCYSLA